MKLSKKTNKFYLASIIVLMLGSSSCENHPDTTPKPANQDQSNSANCLEIKSDQVHLLIENVNQLKLGDAKEKVLSVLGKPSAESADGAKNSDKITGNSIDYFIKKCESPSFGDLNDKIIRIKFGIDNKIHLIEAINVDGVVTKSLY